MSKLICYSLFDGPKEKFEKLSYIRGFYMNARMNNLIYPDFRTHLEVDFKTYVEFQGLFEWLKNFNALSLNVNDKAPPLCEGMLWRLKPIFYENISKVICRDADAITTYKEAQCVQEWIESDMGFHAMNDNPAHAGLMGGMIGFDCAKIKAVMGWHSWSQIVKGDFSRHGADQDYFNKNVLPKIQNDLFLHNLAGAGCPAKHVTNNSTISLPQVDKKLWESNLIPRFIGSAGFNEMEALRFFKRFDEYNWKFKEIENAFPKLFWWV